MKLFPPDPTVDLYNDGFNGRDCLNRQELGKKLSRIVDQIDDPLVMALDGKWGSGKSFFLRCWVGAHSNENDGSALTVYIDAFEHDYMDDPIVALTSSINERIDPKGARKTAWQSARAAAAKIWRPAARIGLAVGTSGLTEISKPIVDSALESGSKELEKQIDRFWVEQEGRKAAMEDFRAALRQLTDPDEEGVPKHKLAIVIDELDRCRPDYALAVLETIKHFFNENGIHFILGINLDELENSVRARYGEGVKADLYLQKFISLFLRLPEQVGEKNESAIASIAYFDFLNEQMGIESDFASHVRDYLELDKVLQRLSLRTVRQILSTMVLVQLPEGGFAKFYPGFKMLIAGLIVLKTVYPELYQRSVRQELTFGDLSEAIGIPNESDDAKDRKTKFLFQVWATFLAPLKVDDNQNWRGLFGSFGVGDPTTALRSCIEQYLEQLSLTLEK